MEWILLGAAYLLGSIPFGLIFTRFAGAGDIRTLGSGNIGATNVLRTGNKKIAAATLFCDGLKGYIPVMIAKIYMPEIALGAFSLALMGHIFPVWLKFKGGKGVATTLGCLLAVSPVLGFLGIFIWLGILKISKISSLSALVAFNLLPLVGFILEGKVTMPLSFWQYLLLVALLINITHRENITRLLRGEEGPVKS
jgi:glycerol-3-phosphate acyltransferase PlsY